MGPDNDFDIGEPLDPSAGNFDRDQDDAYETPEVKNNSTINEEQL